MSVVPINNENNFLKSLLLEPEEQWVFKNIFLVGSVENLKTQSKVSPVTYNQYQLIWFIIPSICLNVLSILLLTYFKRKKKLGLGEGILASRERIPAPVAVSPAHPPGDSPASPSVSSGLHTTPHTRTPEAAPQKCILVPIFEDMRSHPARRVMRKITMSSRRKLN